MNYRIAIGRLKMSRKIYWAGPLHDVKDQKRNEEYVEKLRNAGYQVYLPQEHGVWEEMLGEFNNDEKAVRKHLFTLDLQAMKEADMCIACCGDVKDPRGPSEGMLWEMGWMTAANKNVLLFNENDYWRFNLMPQFGSIVFNNFDKLLEYLKGESFK